MQYDQTPLQSLHAQSRIKYILLKGIELYAGVRHRCGNLESRAKNARCIRTLTFDPLPYWERGRKDRARVANDAGET